MVYDIKLLYEFALDILPKQHSRFCGHFLKVLVQLCYPDSSVLYQAIPSGVWEAIYSNGSSLWPPAYKAYNLEF